MTYSEIAEVFTKHPRDVQTQPTYGTPIWFYVSGYDGKLYISAGRSHEPKSRKLHERLKENELERMLDIYHRRKCGEPVSREAKEVTRCQVYWYGIFAELGL